MNLAWRRAYVEAAESGHTLLLHFENIHAGGEFLPLQHALLQGYATQFPAAHCTLSIGSEATTWLLTQLATHTLPLRQPEGERQAHVIHWIGPIAGMQTCVLNTLVSRAVVNGIEQGIYGDDPHVQRILSPIMSLDRASALPHRFMPVVASHPAPEAPGLVVARVERPLPPTDALASWLGFLAALVIFLFGFTQFFLRFL